MIEATFGSRHLQAKALPTRFHSPLKVLTATSHDEIYPLLAAAAAAARAGNWVALLLTYEAAPAFDPAMKTREATGIPLAWAGIFSTPEEHRDETIARDYEVGPWTPLVSRAEFSTAIDQIRELIAAGHTYQVNYTFPLQASFRGDSLSWFRDLCRAQGAEYCAYFDLSRYQVLSISPELFFEQEGQTIRTRPMKGTIKRGRWTEEDVLLARQLSESVKDRAENVMIVDLLRNDVGRIAVTGSVNVKQLFALERYETLWQMTSTIEAAVRSDIAFPEMMGRLFPCGSITGAPKIRTMEIIRELEPFPRGVYTGTLGFLRPDGSAVFNVAIRTIVVDSETGLATFGVGGGITYDSTAEREYEECLVKSSFLASKPIQFDLLETMLLEAGKLVLLERHLTRMRASAEYFGFTYPEAEICGGLVRTVANHASGRWKIRLLVSREGNVRTEVHEMESTSEQRLRVALAQEPVDSSDKFLFHKTTNRAIYERALAARPDCDDVILWNEAGEVTESTIANVVICLGNQLFTPPRSAGLLAGTLREQLLVEGKILERPIYRDELQRSSEIFLINSVSGWRRATLVS
ncbi:MAG TPA: aminodeoxychorismate synthase component I [Pyrinomonadaceae bacterium]|nr:aminodeoxychorismate synthase component I [Pyrinomonadaceae bacterium]